MTREKKDELFHKLEAGRDTMREALLRIRGSVLRMSFEPLGCRVVQLAFDVTSMVEKHTLLEELHGHVLQAIASPHANFVIQKVIEVLPASSATFVAEEVATLASEVARHRFGCRVFSRLVEHHLCNTTAGPATDNLVHELLQDTDQLIRHNFARHVLELILEHGSDKDKHSIAETIRSNATDYAKNRSASYVVEKALACCGAPDARAIAWDLLADPQCLLALARHECGIHVVKAAMKVNADCALKAKEVLLAEADWVKSSKYGRRLFDEM